MINVCKRDWVRSHNIFPLASENSQKKFEEFYSLPHSSVTLGIKIGMTLLLIFKSWRIFLIKSFLWHSFSHFLCFEMLWSNAWGIYRGENKTQGKVKRVTWNSTNLLRGCWVVMFSAWWIHLHVQMHWACIPMRVYKKTTFQRASTILIAVLPQPVGLGKRLFFFSTTNGRKQKCCFFLTPLM